MFTPLNPTLPLHVLDRGDAYAIGVIDYGQEHNLIWVSVLNETGEVWCAPNPMIRFGENWTMGRKKNPLVAESKGKNQASASEAELCDACAEHARV